MDLKIVQLIIYKLELKRIQSSFQIDQKMNLYITKYMYDLVSKKIILVKKFQNFHFEYSHLSSQKILIFSYYNINRLYFKKIPFVWPLLTVYTSTITNISLQENNLFDINEIRKISDKVVMYRDNLEKFFFAS